MTTLLDLFPHRYDFIWAEYPEKPQERPEWKTETRYCLSDRALIQPGRLYGVSFGAKTRYILLDVDRSSVYHPAYDPNAIPRMMHVLEPLGLTDYVAVQSSYRGGIHLYLPFPDERPSWAIAQVVLTLLSAAGFKPSPGQLEVFPNSKPYTQEISHYKAHRLPLQIGSYLLNEDWAPINSPEQVFVGRWQFAQARNQIDEATYQQVLTAARSRKYQIRGTAAKYLDDLNHKIQSGWTGNGQTNELLRWIATRERVFGHILHDREPLEGQALVDAIVEMAIASPGYEDWCGHQHDIRQRAEDWSRFVERRHYPYMGQAIAPEAREKLNVERKEWKVTWNKFQQDESRGRIRVAVAQLIQQSDFPEGATARATALKAFGISTQTLYRHKDLWHPQHFVEGFHPVHLPPLLAESQNTPETSSEQGFHPVHPNEFVSDERVDAVCAPSEQQDQASTLSLLPELLGGVRGGESTGQIGLDDLPPAVQQRIICASLLAMCCEEAARLGWSKEKMGLYALETYGTHPTVMEEWQLDCLLMDLAMMTDVRGS